MPWNDPVASDLHGMVDFGFARNANAVAPPAYSDGFSKDAVDAANIARLFADLLVESKKKRGEADELRARVDFVNGIDGDVTRSHIAFISAIVPLKQSDPSIERMIGIMQEYATLNREVVDAWKADALRRMVEVTNAADGIDDEVAIVRTMLVAGAREIVKPADVETGKKLCPVCFDGEVGVVCVPCGHTLCQECAKAAGTRCSTCRTAVREKIRMYFSV